MITALIPARSGSKRIPDKNIKPLGGIPLMVYSIELANNCPSIGEVFVSTDSDLYADIAKQHHAHVIKRPPELARDRSNDFDWLSHAIPLAKFDCLYAILRPTTPFRTVSLVEQAINYFVDLKGYVSNMPIQPTALRSVEPMSESYFKMYTRLGDLIIPVSRRDAERPNQEVPKTYQANGYIDIVDPDYVEAGSIYGDRIYGFETPPAIEIDTENDWQMAEYYLATREGGNFVFTY